MGASEGIESKSRNNGCSMKERTNFDIKIDRILNILCDQIYDSPLSLLRENVQNAYDAILMRQQMDGTCAGRIVITIEGNKLSIDDNGEGMDINGLKENYWTAGKSGKNTEVAKRAGVVGTFGIGAMANFGVCTELKVVTKRIGQEKTLTSWVSKAELSVSNDCIGIADDQKQRDEYGTTVEVTLDDRFLISPADTENYLLPYVQYLKIPVTVNGRLISQKDYHLPIDKRENEFSCSGDCMMNNCKFSFIVRFNKSNQLNPRIYIKDINFYGKEIKGDLVLQSNIPSLMGLHNEFGLAPAPVSSHFALGGVANLDVLSPTAGRDALSRESVDTLSVLVNMADDAIAKCIADTQYADSCRELMSFIRTKGRYDLANHITIGTTKENERYELGSLADEIGGKKVLYYLGNDAAIKANYGGNDTILLIPSNDYNRQQIQRQILAMKSIEQVSDQPMVFDVLYSDSDLTIPEFSIKIKVKTVIEYDYLIPTCEVRYARISHKLSTVVDYQDGKVIVYLNKEADELRYLTTLYKENYDMFEPFVKDLVRTKLYPKFAQYVPSSQRDGAEALYAMLQRKKELYTIESTEQGRMEFLIDEYMRGNASIKEVLTAVVSAKKSQTQTVNHVNIGSVDEIVGSKPIVQGEEEEEVTVSFEAMPPVMRSEIKTKYKLLRTENPDGFSGYHTFLALSDKMFRDYYDFFLQPHTTRVIWSMHKIIYIFTHVSNNLTLYYDMDLDKKLPQNSTGGRSIVTSTIITENKIFIPVINEMDEYFNIQEGQLKFYVRYDSVKS